MPESQFLLGYGTHLQIWGGGGAGASPRSFVWGDGFIGTQTHLPPKFSFSSDFGQFILEMVENAKLSCVKKNDAEISYFLGGTSPADFSTAGDASARPPPPAFDAHGGGVQHGPK